jgi:predicted CopG family antitoxin
VYKLKTIEISEEVYEYLRGSGKTGDTFTDVILELIKKAENKTEQRKEQLKQSQTDPMIVEPLNDNLKHLEPIMQITNRDILRRPSAGTRIRFRFRGQNYETQINNLSYKYPTLNFIFTSEFNAYVDIWHQEIYFKDEKGWQPITILRR